MISLYDVVRTVKGALVITTTEFSAPMLKSARIRAGYAESEYLFLISGIAT